MGWHETRFGEVLVNGTGRIVGEVSKVPLGAGYIAQSNGDVLGTYLTEQDAKRAVEKASRCHPVETG